MTRSFSNIKGYSNFNVELINDNGKLFIKKNSTDKKYNDKLKLQFDKQFNFYLNKVDNIIIPKIHKYGKENNLFYFIMEYYNSYDYVEFSETSDVFNFNLQIDILFKFIHKNILESKHKNVTNLFLKKYEDVKSKVNFDYKKTDKLFYNITEITVPIGKNHGDLTFSNILFSKNNKDVILIDFLDNFIETPLNDIVKLKQDTKHKWLYNVYNTDIDKTRMNILFNVLDKKIHNEFKDYDFYKKYEKIFSILNLLRILPYAKDNKIKNYIKNELREKYDV
jgi:hypothetical protein